MNKRLPLIKKKKKKLRLCPSSRFSRIIIVSSFLILATGPRISFRVLRQNSSSVSTNSLKPIYTVHFIYSNLLIPPQNSFLYLWIRIDAESLIVSPESHIYKLITLDVNPSGIPFWVSDFCPMQVSNLWKKRQQLIYILRKIIIAFIRKKSLIMKLNQKENCQL